MAVACICISPASMVHAQNPGQVTITDPTEFHAYQNASAQSDPGARASALESFLLAYPQSVVKKAVLDQLIDSYQATKNGDSTLSAASRLLQVDPNNLKATFISVSIKRTHCLTTMDAQTCDDAAALAQSGLVLPKPVGMADADFKKVTDQTYPMYHSAIALDDI